jgi:hypothetical protein
VQIAGDDALRELHGLVDRPGQDFPCGFRPGFPCAGLAVDCEQGTIVVLVQS